ncbi:hypothetical protein BBJ28_00008493 [Nothophytophthora sp. Chile5]|nr:hypothetical protein BBJ28_00008493 [Nothophytophthora sp. Chile5]
MSRWHSEQIKQSLAPILIKESLVILELIWTNAKRFLAASVFCLLVLSVLLSGHTLSTLFSSPSTPQVNYRQEIMASSKHALVVGASSGIGLGVAKEVAPLVAKLTLCSRSLPADLLESIKEKNPDVEVVHEKLDVSLLHEVRKFTTKHADTQFDWIVLSPGFMTINGRTETSEGLDVKMCTHYYGRYATLQLLIYLMAQALSEHAPQASFMHVDPGFVSTGLLDKFPWYLRLPGKALTAVVGRSPEMCGQQMVSALTKDEFATGWHLVGPNAKEVAKTKYQTDDLKDVVWKHTLQTIDDVMKQ